MKDKEQERQAIELEVVELRKEVASIGEQARSLQYFGYRKGSRVSYRRKSATTPWRNYRRKSMNPKKNFRNPKYRCILTTLANFNQSFL